MPLYDHLSTYHRLGVPSKWREGLLCLFKLLGDIGLLLWPRRNWIHEWSAELESCAQWCGCSHELTWWEICPGQHCLFCCLRLQHPINNTSNTPKENQGILSGHFPWGQTGISSRFIPISHSPSVSILPTKAPSNSGITLLLWQQIFPIQSSLSGCHWEWILSSRKQSMLLTKQHLYADGN